MNINIPNLQHHHQQKEVNLIATPIIITVFLIKMNLYYNYFEKQTKKFNFKNKALITSLNNFYNNNKKEAMNNNMIQLNLKSMVKSLNLDKTNIQDINHQADKIGRDSYQIYNKQRKPKMTKIFISTKFWKKKGRKSLTMLSNNLPNLKVKKEEFSKCKLKLLKGSKIANKIIYL